MADYQNTKDTATLSRLRSAHLARLCGITDNRAAMLAALAFAGCAP